MIMMTVVRCLAFVVVQALMRARGSSGAQLFNGGGIVGFDWGNRFSWSFYRRALCRAVLIERDGVQAVECDEVDAPPVFAVVARQSRISAQIIFFQRREGVRSGKGARACG